MVNFENHEVKGQGHTTRGGGILGPFGSSSSFSKGRLNFVVVVVVNLLLARLDENGCSCSHETFRKYRQWHWDHVRTIFSQIQPRSKISQKSDGLFIPVALVARQMAPPYDALGFHSRRPTARR